MTKNQTIFAAPKSLQNIHLAILTVDDNFKWLWCLNYDATEESYM